MRTGNLACQVVTLAANTTSYPLSAIAHPQLPPGDIPPLPAAVKRQSMQFHQPGSFLLLN
jgi:hypothetical protein